ncbi:DUF4249 domain-containing protein [bacterium]|nr:DUF4249 domain-containing protein [bacterium]
MKNLIYIIIGLVFISCEDQFLKKLPNPEAEDQISVYCVLFADQAQIKAELYHSKKIFGPVDTEFEDYDPVTDAVVKIIGPNETITLEYNSTLEEYQFNDSIDFQKAGDTYYLEITTVDGKKITSQTTIPFNTIEGIKMDYDSIPVNPRFGISEMLFESSFQDMPGEGHYYQLLGRYSSGFGTEQIQYETPLYLADDKDRDGESIDQTGRGYKIEYDNTLDFYMVLQSISRDLYLYNRSMNSYANFTFDPDNPFTEPTIIHTNIEGGLGVFGSSNQKVFNFTK